MSNISDLKPGNQSKLLSNIRILKIIAIILGFLIILGLFFLIFGITKSYNNLKNIEKSEKNNIVVKNQHKTNFNFFHPLNSQLISTSMGANNRILLRYLHQGNNVLVILNTNSKRIESIITLKRGQDFGNKKE